MTVEELIKLLQECPPKKEVRIGGRSHKTPGKPIEDLWHGSHYIEIYPV